MSAHDSSPGYRWAVGSWFGPLVGCTAWMLVLALLAWAHDALAGAVTLGAYLLANALGVTLWWRRQLLPAHTALQLQLAVTFLLAVGVITFIEARFELAQLDEGFGSRQIYGALLVYPLLMFVFWMRERAVRRKG